jgi:hypothetical protein
MIFVPSFKGYELLKFGEKCGRCRGQFLQGGGRLISSYFEVGNWRFHEKSGGGGKMPGRDKRYSTQMGRQAATGGLGEGREGVLPNPYFFPDFFCYLSNKGKVPYSLSILHSR